MKIAVFAGSSSKRSINRQLAHYCASFFKDAQIDRLDLNDYEMPLFSVDAEAQLGPQKKAAEFMERLSQCDLIILSLAEHNGSYSVAFKNILDWSSRQNKTPFQNKKMLLLATSPGARGGRSVLDSATARFPFLGASLVGTFSLPEFGKNFDAEKGITSPDHLAQLKELIGKV
ncbi:MAG: NADPH-dependent FMN reductase [Pseudobdellovibrio sp.]